MKVAYQNIHFRKGLNLNEKKLSLIGTAFLIAFLLFYPIGGHAESEISQGDVRQLTIDGNTVDTNPANTFKGFGMVSGNGTSRLLLDYKAEHPKQYWKLMNELFNPRTGAGLNFIKVELGADVNTSTAVTPATKRTEGEKADVLRGWDWHIVADAQKINPSLQVDALRWAEPKWVTNAFGSGNESGYAARYKWYKETIDAVYDTYKVKFSYISPDKNETGKPDPDWIKYFASHLKNEGNERYDYSKIKIVASDQIGATSLPTLMKNDEELRNDIDVISMHYNAHGTADMRLMNQQYHKQIWYSEGVAPSTYAQYRLNTSEPKGGLGGTSGALDIANHFINMYQSGESTSAYMTRYEFQPAVGSFYDGGQYSSKELIEADSPWSGYYYTDAGIPVVRQFMNFIKPGWQYVQSASFGDGKGDNSISDTTNNYLTLTDTQKNNYSVVMTNDSNQVRNYKVTVKNMKHPGKILHVWETSGPKQSESYDARWLKHVANIHPKKESDGSYTFTYNLQPNTIATLSTTSGQKPYHHQKNQDASHDQALSLPYKDDFEYSDLRYMLYRDRSVADPRMQSYSASRNGTPRYTEDIGGAFEVTKQGRGHVLEGVIDRSTHANGEWNTKSGNDTVLGDDRWADYEVGVDFKLDLKSQDSSSNYAGIVARNLITGGGDNAGYIFRVYANGNYQLTKNGQVLKSGKIDQFDNTKWHNEALKVVDNSITASIDHQQVINYQDTTSIYTSGKVGLTTGYAHTQYMAFGNTVAEIHWKNELMHVILFEDNVFQKNRLHSLRLGIISFKENWRFFSMIFIQKREKTRGIKIPSRLSSADLLRQPLTLKTI
ncbi:hypothetical protein M3N64_05695 [Sporolactobacillus sp. CPB3-1]|uniref:Uncharacterized protein n=1 Tax=Sporolactobacillus mangiferae TaxID=2940498 RepID=A0ABT0M995_9BACL|nr:hypothetical protein [Sporolactobacillus mangiferae]